MAQAVRQRFTVDEYLIVEEQGEIEHEFLDGQVWAMAGGSPEHAAIAANLAALFTTALRGQRCRGFSADLRVRILATGLATYPDLTIVCERLEPDPADRSGHTVTNPRVVVEVLSPSTEDYDRTEKLGTTGRCRRWPRSSWSPTIAAPSRSCAAAPTARGRASR